MASETPNGAANARPDHHPDPCPSIIFVSIIVWTFLVIRVYDEIGRPVRVDLPLGRKGEPTAPLSSVQR